MSRFWKEPYSVERAQSIGIHDGENIPFLGVTYGASHDPEFRGWPKTIYFVEVCSFTFAFFSLAMLREYLDFYSRKILPTSRFYGVSPFSDGAAASVGDGQTRFERLPLRLRKEPKRLRVVKALTRALEAFETQETMK